MGKTWLVDFYPNKNESLLVSCKRNNQPHPSLKMGNIVVKDGWLVVLSLTALCIGVGRFRILGGGGKVKNIGGGGKGGQIPSRHMTS